MSSGLDHGHDDLFWFTAGRWLWNEDERLRERYRPLNVSVLKSVAAAAVHAQRCVSITKLCEGGSNRILRLIMDNDAVVVARIPYAQSRASTYSLSSEVATLDCASRILHIPVPRVLGWSASSDNPVRSAYILMAEASGQQLGTVWEHMTIDVKVQIAEQLAEITKQLLSVQPSLYGSLYFTGQCLPGCESVHFDGAVSGSVKAEAERCFVIGPVTEESFWNGEREAMHDLRGPWQIPQQYIKSIARREKGWHKSSGKQSSSDEWDRLSSAHIDGTVHTTLYDKLLEATDSLLPADTSLTRPALWHWDLHAPNIFVTDGKITSIIDWQDCWAGPLMLQAQTPPLVDYKGELMLRHPSYYKQLEDEAEKAAIDTKIEKSLVLFLYQRKSHEISPQLKLLFHLPMAELIRRTILFAANTSREGLIPFRECLLKVESKWSEARPGEQCPYTFTADERRTHAREGRGYNEIADFWDSLSGLVNRDAYVASEDYDKARALFASLREESLANLKGESRDAFERATRWAG